MTTAEEDFFLDYHDIEEEQELDPDKDFVPREHDFYKLNVLFETQQDIEEFCAKIGRPELANPKRKKKNTVVNYSDLPISGKETVFSELFSSEESTTDHD
jgi:hypothetical protein